MKLGAKKDGTIVAADVELKFQAGAFPARPCGSGRMTALACYDIPNFRIVGCDVVTNTPESGGLPRPGAPISRLRRSRAPWTSSPRNWACDPIDLRLKNGARDGVKAAYGPTFQQHRPHRDAGSG